MPPCNPFTGADCSEREKRVIEESMRLGSRREATDALLKLQDEFDQTGLDWSDEQRRAKLEDINIVTKLLGGNR